MQLHKQRDMLYQIKNEVRFTSRYLQKDSLSQKVLNALEKVPRHCFVPSALQAEAYENNPLPIGHGQTISQPYIVAIMTDLLNLSYHDKVLEVGTGSGYQTAILAELTEQVYSLEIIDDLTHQAREALTQLGYNNIELSTGDGYYGWDEHAPFDAIMVTAAATHVPHALLEQLKPGGLMMIPIGTQHITQKLMMFKKEMDGHIKSQEILPVSFVPLTGRH